MYDTSTHPSSNSEKFPSNFGENNGQPGRFSHSTNAGYCSEGGPRSFYFLSLLFIFFFFTVAPLPRPRCGSSGPSASTYARGEIHARIVRERRHSLYTWFMTIINYSVLIQADDGRLYFHVRALAIGDRAIYTRGVFVAGGS